MSRSQFFAFFELPSAGSRIVWLSLDHIAEIEVLNSEQRITEFVTIKVRMVREKILTGYVNEATYNALIRSFM